MDLYALLARLRVFLLGIFDARYKAGLAWWRRLTREPQANFEALQMQRLSALLDQFSAQKLIPAGSYGERATFISHQELGRLPVMDRSALMEYLPLVEQANAGRTDLILKRTSGSTGEPVRHLREKRLERTAEALYNKMYGLTGWRPGVYRVGLWGSYTEFGMASQTGARSRLLCKWVIGTFAPTAEQFRLFYDEVLARRGCAVFGYASLIAEACRVLEADGLSVPPGHVRCCFTGAETLLPAMRQQIERVLGCQVFDGYSSRESEHIAMECRARTRHVNPRYILEAVRFDSDEPCAPGEVGRLLVTDLFNRVTPHLRYEIGDAGSVAWRECSCGLKGQTLPELQGRLADIIHLPDGRRISTLYFAGLMQERDEITEYQLVRRGDSEFVLRYTGEKLSPSVEQGLRELVQALMGQIEFEFAQVTEIKRTAGGKWRSYIDERPGAAVDQKAR